MNASNQCTICFKLFARPQGLKRHLGNIHKKDDFLLCGLCNSKHLSLLLLQKHMQTKHPTKNCSHCSKTYNDARELRMHILRVHTKERFFCHYCTTSFTRKENLKEHIYSYHIYKCKNCKNHFMIKADLESHELLCMVGGAIEVLEPVDENDENILCEEKTAMNGVISAYKFPNISLYKDPAQFLIQIRKQVENQLIKDVETHHGIKFSLAWKVNFIKEVLGQTPINAAFWFCSKHDILLAKHEFASLYETMSQELLKRIEDFQNMGSGWVYNGLEAFRLNILQYRPYGGSSYIALPNALKKKTSILNIVNKDKKCFIWCVLAYLYPVSKHPDRVSKYKLHEKKLNLKGLQFPMDLSQISRFEENNKININIFGYVKERKKKGEFFPLRISRSLYDKHVEMLYMRKGNKTHYCLIKSLSGMLSKVTKHKSKAYYCMHCLHRFSSEKCLNEHKTLCSKHEAQKLTYPKPGKNILKFDKHSYTLPVPFRIYADFESFNSKINEENNSNTVKCTNHEPSGFAFIIVDIHGNLFEEPQIYRGENVVFEFLSRILAVEERLMKILKNPAPLKMSDEDEFAFQSATDCNICKKPLLDDRVRDHCHITGKFRQALHNECNLNLKMCTHIPVFFHNLKKYDAHLIMQDLGIFQSRRLKCIAKTWEDYISFSVGHLRFLDTYQFMASSLDKLVQNLKDGGKEKFKLTNSHFPPNQVDLMLCKGVYPYEYINDPNKFLEEALPPIESFYSSLTQENISQEQYEHAQNIWSTFNIKNLGEYQDLYVISDVLLLADVFETFRALCFENDGIDPCHVYTAPSLAFQSCLKLTEIKLELLTDPDMFLFYEEGIRGGISVVTHRYSSANNKYMKEYDQSKPSKFIIYWDCTNLYGYAMRKPLPTGGFRWLSEQEIENFDINSIEEEGDDGFTLCVDLEYPESEHNAHSDYPFAVEREKIKANMLSPYCKILAEELNISTNSKVEKLLPSLKNKENYIMSHVNLKQCLERGLKLVKIHKILTFKQSPWMQPFVDFNTQKRKEATNDFEKDFYKLKINSMYGKSMENMRNRMTLELVNKKPRILRLVGSPAFEDFRIFDNDLVAIRSKKPSIVLDKPIYIGFNVLELSKAKMYSFHYDFVKHKYGDKARLLLSVSFMLSPKNNLKKKKKKLLSDTDSMVYEITTDDLYKDLEEHHHLFDNSVYPTDHPLYNIENKKKVGTFKDEFAGVNITECVALRPKLYSILTEDGEEKKVGKGIIRSSLKKFISHSDYKNTIFTNVIEDKQKFVEMYSIRNQSHHLYTIRQNKLSLSPFENKRYILDDGITSLPYGHYQIPK